jgi:hypothetical protein
VKIVRRPWHLVGTGVFLVALVAGCGAVGDLSASKPRVKRAAGAATTVSTLLGESSHWSAPEVGLSLESVPAGFETWLKVQTVAGPGDGWTNSSQEFRKPGPHSFIVAVTRGKPSQMSLVDGQGKPRGVESSERVGDYPTYFFDLSTVSGQLSYGWVVDSSTMGWVTAYNLPQADILHIARSVTISAPTLQYR